MDGFWGIQGCILFLVTLQKHLKRVQMIETTIKNSSIGRPFNLGWFYFEKMATQEQTLYHKNCNRLSRFFLEIILVFVVSTCCPKPHSTMWWNIFLWAYTRLCWLQLLFLQFKLHFDFDSGDMNGNLKIWPCSLQLQFW